MKHHLPVRVLMLVLSMFAVFSVTAVFAASVEFKVDTEMPDSFIGRFNIVNNELKMLDDLTFEFDLPYKITSVWDAVMVSDKANHYVIKLPGWITSIPPDENFKFGFNATPGYTGIKPSNLKLNGVPAKLSGQ